MKYKNALHNILLELVKKLEDVGKKSVHVSSHNTFLQWQQISVYLFKNRLLLFFSTWSYVTSQMWYVFDKDIEKLSQLFH